MVVWLIFWSSKYTHGLRLQWSPTTIEQTLDLMESSYMVHTTMVNPFHKCFCMFYIYHKNLEDYIWSQLGLGYMVKQIYDKYMTNIWQFGGPKSMQENPWLRMISSRYKTLLIWTENTRRAIGGYIRTWQFLFNHKYVFTQMVFFYFQGTWGGDSSPLQHWDPNTYAIQGHALIRW